MAFDRVKALGEYLAQCANLPNFDELLSQQCGVLAQQSRDGGALEFAEGDTGRNLTAILWWALFKVRWKRGEEASHWLAALPCRTSVGLRFI